MPLFTNSEHCIINDDNFLADAALNTGLPNTAVGQLWAIEVNSGLQAIYLISKGTFTSVIDSSYLSHTKDAANKLNFYFEDDVLMAQNKLGKAIYLYVKFEGLV